ncbi:hypothetical protein GTH32_04235 [Alteromonas sp. 345S023]|uniref:DUF3630 family protein n=1 Tax=Alteromonas profundi TaxID=2696062 RepID=A0A7X5RK95_9ALTE|nr:hypothetical protein [Alteromonas profundi]NDV90404.1 hypothetical protein [Alteromonas profundi]
MQQLTATLLLTHSVVSENAIQFVLPLPSTPLKTQQWVDAFCQQFNFTQAEADWGADRFQVALATSTPITDTGAELHCLLCVEWLCEAIWLEPIGTNQDPHRLFAYLHAQK